MSVIATKEDDIHGVDNCARCGDKAYRPYLQWLGIGKGPLILCGKCCRVIKGGFMADLIQIVAILDLQMLWRSDATLQRDIKHD